MNDIDKKHIAHIEAVNNAKTVEEHDALYLYLNAWRDGVRDAGGHVGLIAADMYYANQGIERPMCCGVWLDWTPE